MKTYLIILLFIVISPKYASADLTAKLIMDKSIEAFKTWVETGSAKIKLEIYSEKGDKKDRVLSVLSKRKEGFIRSKVTFLDPPDVRDTSLLLLEQKGESIQYLYLPAIKKVRKIAGSEKYNDFMGSDFTHADIESHDIKEGKYEKLADEIFSGRNCYKISVIPNNKEFYGMIDVFVDKDTFLPLKIIFYDKEQKNSKILISNRIEKKDNKNVITSMIMKNIQKGTKTHLIIEELNLKAGFEDSLFEPENLGR